MNATETIQAAIKRLTQVKETLGHVMLGENPGELYIRCDTDVDDDGNLYSYGLSVSGVDSDDEINEAILALHRTIDAQLAILRHEADRLASWYRMPAAIRQFTSGMDMDGTWFEIPERAAFEMGLPLRQGGIRHPNPVYLEAELNAAGVKTREAVPAEAKIVDLARAILGEDGQSVDATRLGVPAATASETGFDLELGEDGQ